jgi:hypothetical protein
LQSFFTAAGDIDFWAPPLLRKDATCDIMKNNCQRFYSRKNRLILVVKTFLSGFKALCP